MMTYENLMDKIDLKRKYDSSLVEFGLGEEREHQFSYVVDTCKTSDFMHKFVH